MDRHTHLLASVLQTCTMLHPDDPKAAVEHANRILDQVEIFDNERYVRPLAEDLDEELTNIQDDLLPDPGDMVPVEEPKGPPAMIRDWIAQQNELSLIRHLEHEIEAHVEKIKWLEANALLDKGADFYEEVLSIRNSGLRILRTFAFRELHQATWSTKFYPIEALHEYIAGNDAANRLA